MRRMKWQIFLVAALLLAFAAVSLVHFLLFRDARTLLFYLLLDLAFIPVQVLVVSLILDGLLSRREKRVLLKKLNMVIGAFFSEAGTQLLGRLAAFLPGLEELRRELVPGGQWTAREFNAVRRSLEGREIRLDSRLASLAGLKEFLAARQDFILRLLENSNLLEHDSFAELLWAVLHVAEELAARPRLDGLPPADCAHLSGDLTRAYGHLLREWISYLRHLKEDYPYLFSLAVRTNPFDPNASAVVDGNAPAAPDGNAPAAPD
jgi:hypothetical protein